MMPWWAWVTLYTVGGLTALRILMLWAKDDSERRWDNCPRCKTWDGWCKECKETNEVTGFLVALGAFFWPLPLTYMTIGKIMFPRGVVTKYSREKAAKAKAKEAAQRDRERAAAIEQFCRDNNLPVPMFLKETQDNG